MYVYIYTYIYIHTHTRTHSHTYKHTHTHTHTYIHSFLRLHACYYRNTQIILQREKYVTDQHFAATATDKTKTSFQAICGV